MLPCTLHGNCLAHSNLSDTTVTEHLGLHLKAINPSKIYSVGAFSAGTLLCSPKRQENIVSLPKEHPHDSACYQEFCSMADASIL